MKRYLILVTCVVLAVVSLTAQQHKTLRQWGFPTGIFETGQYNAITDVPGVAVGHVTLSEGDSVRTGVTAIVPHQGNIFRQKVPAAIVPIVGAIGVLTVIFAVPNAKEEE